MATEPEVTTETKQDLALLEAALYVAGRPLDLRTLASVLRTRSKNKARRLAKILALSFKARDTALEVLELEDERFVMQLKTEYTPQVRRLAFRPLLSIGPLKTLSYVAYRQPVSQTLVIEVRGGHAYDHLKQLEELDLIARERAGRSRVLRTTQFFADYFGFSHDLKAMKQQLKNVFEKEDIAKMEQKPEPTTP